MRGAAPGSPFDSRDGAANPPGVPASAEEGRAGSSPREGCQVLGTGAAAGGGPGALPWPGQRGRGGARGICSKPSLDGRQRRVRVDEVLAPGNAVRQPRSPPRLPVQTLHSRFTSRLPSTCLSLGWVSFHLTLAQKSALEGPSLRPPQRRTFQPPLTGHRRS